ncbi:MAG: dihydrofolate reductase [Hyphomicrobiaceae bacterium]|nr:dihydrofolate reductase [Hyphomicrobiaceae bacterium]
MPDVIVSIIVAVAENGVIGRDGGLPWRISSDLKRFRALTLGKPVIMGRRTFESLGKPLDGRDNIVVTSRADWRPAGAHVVGDLAAALRLARELAARRGVGEVVVIGGGQLYGEALALTDRIYLSRVHARPEGDVTFPPLAPEAWREISREEIAAGPRDDHAFTLIVLERRKHLAT